MKVIVSDPNNERCLRVRKVSGYGYTYGTSGVLSNDQKSSIRVKLIKARKGKDSWSDAGCFLVGSSIELN